MSLRRVGRPRKTTDAQIEQLRKMHASGASVDEIAEQLQIHRNTVAYWIVADSKPLISDVRVFATYVDFYKQLRELVDEKYAPLLDKEESWLLDEKSRYVLTSRRVYRLIKEADLTKEMPFPVTHRGGYDEAKN